MSIIALKSAQVSLVFTFESQLQPSYASSGNTMNSREQHMHTIKFIQFKKQKTYIQNKECPI